MIDTEPPRGRGHSGDRGSLASGSQVRPQRTLGPPQSESLGALSPLLLLRDAYIGSSHCPA